MGKKNQLLMYSFISLADTISFSFPHSLYSDESLLGENTEFVTFVHIPFL